MSIGGFLVSILVAMVALKLGLKTNTAFVLALATPVAVIILMAIGVPIMFDIIATTIAAILIAWGDETVLA